MIRTWTSFSLIVSLAALLVVGTANGQNTSDSGAKPVPRSVADQLQQIQASIDKLHAQFDDGLRAVNGNILNTDIKAERALRRIADLEQEIAALHGQMDQLQQRLRTANSISAYGPLDSTPRSSRVRLVNEYVLDVAVVVNGVSYHLRPSDQRTVDVPAGTFSYEVLNLQQGPQTRTVAPGNTFTITVHPLG